MTDTYSPLLVCNCGASFHAAALAAHADYWHSPQFPAFPRLATRAEHEADGWDVTDYPRSVST